MKLKTRLYILLFGFLTTVTLTAQNQPTAPLANSLLWEISGNGLTEKSYLFGTQHMICADKFKLKDYVTTTLSSADKLVLEIDFDDPAEMQKMAKLTVAEKPLSETLTKEQYHKLDSVLQANIQMKASDFENFTLLAIMSTYISKSIKCTPKMIELELITKAMSQQKELVGLETVDAQMEAFSKGFTTDEIIDELGYNTDSYFDEMSMLYASEKLSELYAYVTKPEMVTENNLKYLFTDRNKNWVDKLPSMMKDQSLFIAVGAGHLAGDTGVIKLLRKAGYTVNPITK
ncbi:conjugative transfer protein GumN [Neptunitalea chrysea]|uniref:Conjugative transfer protein GumN n=1 Tax=Neptunitalea chrysea TaxID=1647581 RepID=A0A9W6EU26_9FLAO|nr:TraB/GumN family protein [Neptunitalea chrysea]GLB52940.1 conjugative transfer protein GumN [Neptunitalea chrysea]